MPLRSAAHELAAVRAYLRQQTVGVMQTVAIFPCLRSAHFDIGKHLWG